MVAWIPQARMPRDCTRRGTVRARRCREPAGAPIDRAFTAFATRVGRFVWALIFGVLGGVLAGCASTFTYRVDGDRLPSADATALVERWPVSIGVRHAPGLRDEDTAVAEAARVVFGQEVVAGFDRALRQRFASVQDVDALSPGRLAPSAIAGIVGLAAVRAYPDSRQLMLDVEFRTPEGQLLEKWTVTGTAGVDPLAGPLLMPWGAHLAWMIRDTLAALLVGLADRPAVRAWREAASDREREPLPTMTAATEPATGDSAVVFVRDRGDWLYGDASEAQRCIGTPFQALRPLVPVVPFDRLRLALFPWLEWSAAPRTDEELLDLVRRPEVARVLAGLRVRYFVHAGGATSTDLGQGGVLCGGSAGGGGCFGFAWGTRESAYRATVIDLATAVPLATEAVSRSAGAYVPAFLIPVPIIGPTKTDACGEIARRIHARISGKSTERTSTP